MSRTSTLVWPYCGPFCNTIFQSVCHCKCQSEQAVMPLPLNGFFLQTDLLSAPLFYNSMEQNIRSVESVRVSARSLCVCVCPCICSHSKSRNYERIVTKFGTGVENRNGQDEFVSSESRKMVRCPFAHKTAQKRPEIGKSQPNRKG